MCSPALPTADKFGNVPIDVLFLRGPVERFLRAMQGCDGEVQVGVGPAVLAVSALSASVCGKMILNLSRNARETVSEDMYSI